MSLPPRLFDIPAEQLDADLSGGGLFIDYGACTVRVRAHRSGFASVLRSVYRDFHYAADRDFADFHVELTNGRGLRRWIKPQARFHIDGVEPFEPFPLSSTLPLFEWGVNWCIAQRFNQYVLLHAGTLALGDQAVIMAATPGSGKSTLSAAMMLRGFRLLSDEFGMLDPETGSLATMLKPVALKNRSIDVIREFSKEARLGPIFCGTRKGDVAHLAPDSESVERAGVMCRPALVIFPAYREGAPLQITEQPKEQAFARIAFNSFNYALLGSVAFQAVADIAERCPAYQLTYSKLDEAIDAIRSLVAEHNPARPASLS